MTKRPRLRSRTTRLLYALEKVGPGGATAAELARGTREQPRNIAARLRWLARGKLVRYVADTKRWELADAGLFKEASK